MKAVKTELAPAAIGPYSQGVITGGYVYVSGQIPLDPAVGKLVEGDISVQTDRALKNVSAVLAAAGTGLDKVVKTTVFLAHMSDFVAMNEVYARYFTSDVLPARAAVEVGSLPKGALVEIEVVAEL